MEEAGTHDPEGYTEQRIHDSFPKMDKPRIPVTGVSGMGNMKDDGGIPRGKGSQQAKNKFYYSEA
jgi:hypothetical protein